MKILRSLVLGLPWLIAAPFVHAFSGDIVFADAPLNVSEEAGTALITLRRINSSTGLLQVNYMTADTSAVAGADYTATSGVLSWSDGDDTDQTFAIPIIDDGVVEGDETLTLVLTDPNDPNASTTTTELTILDNDENATLQFTSGSTSAAASVDESAGTISLTVSRTGNASGAVTAGFVTADGSAVSPSDYVATSGSVSWADGESGDKVLVIAIVDDSLEEMDETFSATLFNVTGQAELGSNASVAITIVNDDTAPAGSIVFANTPLSVAEEDDGATITLSRVGGASGVLRAEFITSDGTANAGVDYEAVSGTLIWADGDTVDQTFFIPINNDGAVEGDETLTVALTNPDDPVAASVTEDLTIRDNDEDVELGFADLSVTTSESGDTVTLTVTRTGNGDGAVTVDFATTDGSATAPEDYVAAMGTLSWASGEVGDRMAVVAIVDDVEDEGDEDFMIALSNVTGPARLGADSSVTVVIADDDAAVGNIDFTDPMLTISEDGRSATITLNRSNGSSGELRVAYATRDDTAIAGEDYQSVDGTLVWVDGDTADQSFTIPIVDDAVDEGDETVILTLSDPDDPNAAAVSAVLTIVDNDSVARLQLVTSTVSTGEEAGTVTLTISRTGSPPGDLVVDFNTVDGSALAPADYAATSGTLTWAAGETGNRTIDIPIADDGIVEGDEVFTVSLVDRNDPTAGQVVAIVTINDNDVNADLSFADVSVTTTERGDVVTATVTRSGNAAGAVTVDFTTEDGSALAGEDYTAASGTLSWADGDLGDREVTITILNDSEIEDDEDFGIVLSNITGQAGLGANSTVTVIIGASDGQRSISLAKLNPNQTRVANWFDRTCPRLAAATDLTAEQQDLNDICQSIRNVETTDEEVCDALDAIMPNELFIASFNALRLTAIQHGNLSQRINALRNGATGIDLAGLDIEINGEVIAGAQVEDFVDNLIGGGAGESGLNWGRWGAFIDGRIVAGEKDKSEYEAGFDFDIYGFTAGIDYRIKQNFIVGAAMGYGVVDSDFQRDGGGMDIESISGAAFLTYFNDSTYYLDAMATWGRNDYESTRNIVFNTSGMTVRRAADGETDGDQYSFGVGTGFDFSRGPMTYGPHFGGYYFNVGADAFTERGSSGLELRVDEQRSESLTANLGGHISYAINTDWGVLIPNARYDWVREFKNNRETLSFSFLHDPFTNDPNSPSPGIKIETDRPDSNYFIWSVGMHVQLIYGISGFVDYKSFTGYDNVTLNEVSGGVRWERTW